MVIFFSILAQIEAQADGPEEKRTQVFAALKGRDVKMSAVEPCFWSRVVSVLLLTYLFDSVFSEKKCLTQH